MCRSSMNDDDDEITYSFTLNSGGAITMLSSPVDEYDEMLLKLRAVRTALEEEFPVLRQGKNEVRKKRNITTAATEAKGCSDGGDSDTSRMIFTTMRAEIDENETLHVPFLEHHHSRLLITSRILLGSVLPHGTRTSRELLNTVSKHVFSKQQNRENRLFRVRVSIRLGNSTATLEPLICVPFRSEQPFHVSLKEDNIDWTKLTSREVCIDDRLSATDCIECYFKTGDREIYDAPRKRHSGVEDVILQNIRGEVTEFTIGNFAVEISPNSNEWVTPALRSGLLPGVMRQHLLSSGQITQRVLPACTLRSMIESGCRLVGFNALRGLFPLKMKFV